MTHIEEFVKGVAEPCKTYKQSNHGKVDDVNKIIVGALLAEAKQYGDVDISRALDQSAKLELLCQQQALEINELEEQVQEKTEQCLYNQIYCTKVNRDQTQMKHRLDNLRMRYEELLDQYNNVNPTKKPRPSLIAWFRKNVTT